VRLEEPDRRGNDERTERHCRPKKENDEGGGAIAGKHRSDTIVIRTEESRSEQDADRTPEGRLIQKVAGFG
jgi:hypothetical protein